MNVVQYDKPNKPDKHKYTGHCKIGIFTKIIQIKLKEINLSEKSV